MLRKSKQHNEVQYLHSVQHDKMATLQDLNFVYKQLKMCEGNCTTNSI